MRHTLAKRPLLSWRHILLYFLAACVLYFIVESSSWPLVNDAAQFNYLGFLMDQGRAPYRDILEMNMPGTYGLHLAVMHVMGGGALAWRIFDLLVMAVASAAMIAIAWPYDWFAGCFAAALFVLFHGRDGMGETGERDLVIAALLLASYAFIFHALRKGGRWPLLLFGICSGYAITLKPLPLPFVLLLLLAYAITLRNRGRAYGVPVLLALVGMGISFGVVLDFLRRQQSLDAFWYVMHSMLPYYAGLAKFGIHWMLQNSTTASITTIALLAIVATLLVRSWQTWEERALLAAMAFGIFSYFAQQKGMIYHRYPMLAFLLLWAGMQFATNVRRRGWVRVVCLLGIGYGVVVAPIYAHTAKRRVWRQDWETTLTQDLTRLGGEKLSGKVQCLQTSAQCDTVLYRMHLVQATGLAYDYFVFGQTESPVVEQSRAWFSKQLDQNRPSVIVVGNGLFPTALGGYDKLEMWPAFRDYLKEGYTLSVQRSFVPFQSEPLGYRIYVARP